MGTFDLKHKSIEKELILLLSGGLDSTIAYHYALTKYKKEDILPIWFDINQPYKKQELKSLKKSGIPFTTIKLDLIREEFNNIPTKDYPNQIIPGRNLIFATIAASFGKRIWLVALDGETHSFMRDKSLKFFEDTTNLLTYIFSIKREKTIIESPFINKTKTEIVAWALQNNISKKYLIQTSTCYDEKGKCGECSTCFKRWVAFTNNNIFEKTRFKEPWKSKEAQDLIEKYKLAFKNKDFSHYSEKRILETFSALKKVGVKI